MLKLSNNYKGLVSITVTMIIMAIMTLIVISYTVIMRREQRATLDRQLSTQAFYAAESGVNDAIKSGVNSTTCQDPPVPGFDNRLDGDTIKYTCVLTDVAPDDLEYGSISTNESIVLPIDANGNSIRSVKISWEKESSPKDIFRPGSSFDLPPKSTWGNNTTGMLRATLINPSSLARSDLIDNARTYFLYPNTSGDNTVGYGSEIQQGLLVSGDCDDDNQPRLCSVTIDVPNNDLYYLRLKAIYNNVAVTVQAYSVDNPTSTTAPLELFNAQKVIDSTGKAADVLRRIQVRVPFAGGVFPEFAIESMDDICKRLEVWPGGVNIDKTNVPSGVTSCDL